MVDFIVVVIIAGALVLGGLAGLIQSLIARWRRRAVAASQAPTEAVAPESTNHRHESCLAAANETLADS
jgi:hypothetical protein